MRKGENVHCPNCNKLMGKRKKHKHYWKCWRKGEGCKSILKADGTFILNKQR